MNLLVYNFFDETAEEINLFLKNTNFSVYFAISETDLIRILRENSIDIAILKFTNPKQQLIDKILFISPQTKFYISSIKSDYSSGNIFPIRKNQNLNSISNIIKKGV